MPAQIFWNGNKCYSIFDLVQKFGPIQNILVSVEGKGSNNLVYLLHRFPIFQNWPDNCNLGLNVKSCDVQQNFKWWDKNQMVRSPWFSCSRISRATKLQSKSLQIRSSLTSKNNKTDNQEKKNSEKNEGILLFVYHHCHGKCTRGRVKSIQNHRRSYK